MTNEVVVPDIFDPHRWGLSDEAIANLGNRLREFWSRFGSCFRTKTRDSSEHAWTYLRGLLGMETERNFANIARRVIGPHKDGQNLQQFMSDSPWSAQAVIVSVTSLGHGLAEYARRGSNRSKWRSSATG
jgi:hypothetical protein